MQHQHKKANRIKAIKNGLETIIKVIAGSLKEKAGLIQNETGFCKK